MAEEPSLPPLPAVAWNAQSDSLQNTRKRSRDARPLLTSASSDPAIFSSDDDPALDNYLRGRRRKKRYVGSWFQQQPASSDDSGIGDTSQESEPGQTRPRAPWSLRSKGKRTLRRQLDSGVWLGSDASDESLDAVLPPANRFPPSSLPSSQGRVSGAEEAVRQKIRLCIDDGIEDIDLSSMHLETLSNATVAPLSGFSCIPIVSKHVPFQQKNPELKLYLSNNKLERVPKAIFDLSFLTVLSLRGNGLTELPSSIAKLRNLHTLNVSQNSLRYLPAELLELIKDGSKMKHLQLHPNPFYQPDRLQVGHDAAEKERPAEKIPILGHQTPGAFSTNAIARSHVQYNDNAGESRGRPRVAISSSESKTMETDDMFTDPPPPSSLASRAKASVFGAAEPTNRVPSLTELALRSCSTVPRVSDVLPLLPADTPAAFVRLLESAAVQQETGNYSCAVCRRRMIVPRTEWLEWHEITRVPSTGKQPAAESQPVLLSSSPEERAVPFIHRGCSWTCLPRRVERASGSTA